MKRIIEDVLQAEEKVSAIIKDARDKAAEIKRATDNEITEKMNEARLQAREIVQAAVEEAKKDAERLSRDILEQVDRRKDSLLNSRADEIDELVSDICGMILTTGSEKDSK